MITNKDFIQTESKTIWSSSTSLPHESVSHQLNFKSLVISRTTDRPVTHSTSWDRERKKSVQIIFQRIENLKIPDTWLEEGVALPSEKTISTARKIAINLLENYRLFPRRIAPSIEEGILLNYKLPGRRRELLIEILNDDQPVALINDNKNIEVSDYISNIGFDNLINIFQKQISPIEQ